MAIQFPTSVSCAIAGASWLDNASSLSLFLRYRCDALTTANEQYVFRYRLGSSGDQFSLRKGATSDKFRASVTAGGVAVTKDSASAVVQGTLYRVGATWKNNTASPNGFKLYLNGAEDGTGNSTTSQTGAMNASAGELRIAARPSTPNPAEFAVATLEAFMIWVNYALTADQHAALAYGHWPHQIGAPAPALFLPFYEGLTTRFPDLSGNDRHIEAGAITGTPTAVADLWQKQSMQIKRRADYVGSSTVAVPNPWIPIAPVLHPGQVATISGLVNDHAYEVKVNARDTTGNVSADSAIVEATPTAIVVHHPKRVLLGS